MLAKGIFNTTLAFSYFNKVSGARSYGSINTKILTVEVAEMTIQKPVTRGDREAHPGSCGHREGSHHSQPGRPQKLPESECRSAASDSLPPHGLYVHGILQARTPEWGTFPSSKGSSQPRDRTQVSQIAGKFFTS